MARSLRKATLDLHNLAEADDSYGNVIGIIAVHCAIAFSDTLCIRFGGYKSSEGDHTQAAEALQDALGTRSDADMLKNLQRVLARKDQVSYQGTYFTVEDAGQIVRDLIAFSEKAEAILA